MLAARDQENLVHAHQTTAAGKPLNSGIRALQPKTPGNLKTGFRATANDENKPLGVHGQKINLKNEDGKFGKDAFITPVGPRTRAPLAAKTTNAKAQPYKTPAPFQENLKPEKSNKRPSASRRSAKSKIIITPSEPVNTDILITQDDDYVPEPEYAPPPPIELPDPPMEFGYDETFPQFQGMNLVRGWQEIYCSSPKDEHGVSLSLRRDQEMKEEHDRKMDQEFLDDYKRSCAERDDAALERRVEAMIAAGPKKKIPQNSRIDTVKARTAAIALSQTTVPSVISKQTVSSMQKSRKPAFPIHGAKKPVETNATSPAHHAAISKNTIGYPKAKKPPSIVPKNIQQKQKSATLSIQEMPEIDQSKIHPKEFVELYGEPPVESEMWFRLKQHELLERNWKNEEDSELADDLFDTNFFPNIDEADEGDEELFQLPLD